MSEHTFHDDPQAYELAKQNKADNDAQPINTKMRLCGICGKPFPDGPDTFCVECVLD